MSDRFDDWQPPEVPEGRPTKYQWMVQNTANFQLGHETDIGAFTYINALHGVTIEDLVQIGSHCSIYSISTIDGKAGPVVLRQGCCIGTHSTVMPGVEVGAGAVVGAHSLVNRDVPAGETWAGVPARRIK